LVATKISPPFAIKEPDARSMRLPCPVAVNCASRSTRRSCGCASRSGGKSCYTAIWALPDEPMLFGRAKNRGRGSARRGRADGDRLCQRQASSGILFRRADMDVPLRKLDLNALFRESIPDPPQRLGVYVTTAEAFFLRKIRAPAAWLRRMRFWCFCVASTGGTGRARRARHFRGGTAH